MRAIVVVALFCCVSVGTGVVDLLSPSPVRVTGLEAETEDRRWQEARFWDGTLAREAERGLRKRSTVRRAVLPPWTAALWGVLDETRDDVPNGEDGFLFRDGLRGWDSAVRDDVRRSPPRVVSYLARRLRALGVRLVVFPVPSKATMRPELMDAGDRPPAGTYATWLAEMDALGVESVDVAKVFASHADEQLYWRTDTHWSYAGARWAAESAARAADVLVPEAARSTVIRPAATELDAGNILDWMGIDSRGVRAGGLTRWVLDTSGRLHTLERFDVYERETGARATSLVGDPGSLAVLVGTSFTGTSGFHRFVGHYSERRVYVVPSAGGGPGRALEEVLQKASEVNLQRWPKVLVWEFQAHSPYVTPFHFLNLARLAAYLPSPGVAPIGEIDVERTGRGGTERVRWARLTHPGAGRVSLRLARSEERAVLVHVGFGGRHPPMRVRWQPGVGAITVPVLWPDVDELEVRLLSESGAPVKLQDVELVWDLDVARAVRADVGAPEATSDGWRSRTELPAEVLAAAGASILVRSADSAPPGTMEAILRVGGVVKKRWTVDAVPSGLLILAPPRLHGEATATLELKGAGSPPTQVATVISVVPQLGGR